MAGNSIGRLLVLTTFGESHGVATGGVLDGLPAGIAIDPGFIREELNRRNPKNYPFSTPRKEEDLLEILSGLYEGRSTGAPIAFLVRNADQRSGDYDAVRDLYRPSQADFSWEQKYGIRDPRGGGRASARSTVAVVAAGALAKLMLRREGISFLAYVSAIGPVRIPDEESAPLPDQLRNSALNCPDPATEQQMLAWLKQVESEGDTTGGVVTCRISGVPAGLGEPVFDTRQASLAKAMLGLNAVKGFEYGEGFRAATWKGSEHNDAFRVREGRIVTATNRSGGIQGGISNGMEILFRVAFKPVPTLGKEQTTVDREGRSIRYTAGGRHDICVAPRAVPIVEALAALVTGDHWLMARAGNLAP